MVVTRLRLERFSDLPKDIRQLVDFAEEQADHAYTPLLGRWAVGVAVKIKQEAEEVFRATLRRLGAERIRRALTLMVGGSNVEDPEEVGLCDCGERTGLGTAQSFGVGDYCEAIVIIGKREGEEFDYIVLTPCHTCRGRIRAYAARSGLDDEFPIFLVPRRFRDDEENARIVVTALGELERSIPFSSRGIDVRLL